MGEHRVVLSQSAAQGVKKASVFRATILVPQKLGIRIVGFPPTRVSTG